MIMSATAERQAIFLGATEPRAARPKGARETLALMAPTPGDSRAGLKRRSKWMG